jgi:hypothetical protein
MLRADILLDMDIEPQSLGSVLDALGQLLQARGRRFELVVIGGSALQALGLVARPTRDVDVVALREPSGLVPATQLPTDLLEAAGQVASDLGLSPAWLNAGPAELVRFGMPPGFESRLHTRDFGPSLTVHFADRFDQIHLKLYAVVDQGAGRHEADLRALEPTADELVSAARWARTHDPSPGFRQVLGRVLGAFGVRDADVDA